MPGADKSQHLSLTMKVENNLKHQLSIGVLKPGARLVTKDLAEELGMSITPVREALLRLVSVNALSVAPAQAFTVPDCGLSTIMEINQIRYELEFMAVSVAAERLTSEGVTHLRQMLKMLQQTQESGTLEELIFANQMFRFAVYRYSAMPVLCDMIEQLWIRMGPGLYLLYGTVNPDDFRDSVTYYELLMKMLERKNKEESRRYLAAIMNNNIGILRRQYDT